MDVQMPVMDGFEATQMIRGMECKNATIKIIALTANAMHSDKEQCLAIGMNDYISKPFRADELERVILKTLGRAT